MNDPSKEQAASSVSKERNAVSINTTTDFGSQDQVKALLEALHLTAKLAAMDTVTYTSTLTDITPTINYDENDDDNINIDNNNNNAALLQKRLDALQQEWKWEETPLPRLLQSIHSFQSRLLQIDCESDRQMKTEQSLRLQLHSSEQRVQQLEVAIQKIHNKNQTLKLKLQEKQTERKSLLRNVKEYIRQTNKQDEVDEQRIATQLRAHERLLKLEWSSPRKEAGRGGESHSSKAPLRVRTLSENSSLDEDDSESVSSVSSMISFVTDDGVAALRFSTQLDPQLDDTEVVVSFSRGSKIGLQFCTLPNIPASRTKGKIDESLDEPEKKDASFKMPHFSNPFQKKEGADHSFIVCGHYGFDDTVDVPPANGVRLVAVNGESVEQGHWSLNKIRDIVSMDRPFTLTFRQYSLAHVYKDRLEAAISAAAFKHYSGGEKLSLESMEILEEIELEGGRTSKATARLSSWMTGDRKARLDSDDLSVDVGTQSNRPRLPSWMKVEPEHAKPPATLQSPASTKVSSAVTTSNNTPTIKIPAWIKGEKATLTDPSKSTTSSSVTIQGLEVQADSEQATSGADNGQQPADALKKSISNFGSIMVRGLTMGDPRVKFT
jgi:hypothetical protein